MNILKFDVDFFYFWKKLIPPVHVFLKKNVQYKYDFKYMYHYYHTGALINISS